jgi:hypothetical protein
LIIRQGFTEELSGLQHLNVEVVRVNHLISFKVLANIQTNGACSDALPPQLSDEVVLGKALAVKILRWGKRWFE